MTSNSRKVKEFPASTVSLRFADPGMRMFCSGNDRSSVFHMRDTVRTPCTIFLCFVGSGRSTCAPNALGWERGLHPQCLGIIIWMSPVCLTGQFEVMSEVCNRKPLRLPYYSTMRDDECSRLSRVRRLSWAFCM